MANNVIIMRGVPGAGKTTLSHQAFPQAVFCSADDYFVVDGRFCYDKTKLPLAHQACWRKFFDAVLRGEKLIVVDNTNIRAHELTSYMLPAEAHGYAVEVITVMADPQVAAESNVHGATREYVERAHRTLLEQTRGFPP